MIHRIVWAITLALLLATHVTAQDKDVPGIRTKQRITILSANDGQVHLRLGPDAGKPT